MSKKSIITLIYHRHKFLKRSERFTLLPAFCHQIFSLLCPWFNQIFEYNQFDYSALTGVIWSWSKSEYIQRVSEKWQQLHNRTFSNTTNFRGNIWTKLKLNTHTKIIFCILRGRKVVQSFPILPAALKVLYIYSATERTQLPLSAQFWRGIRYRRYVTPLTKQQSILPSLGFKLVATPLNFH
jgi:hypothetical protein